MRVPAAPRFILSLAADTVKRCTLTAIEASLQEGSLQRKLERKEMAIERLVDANQALHETNRELGREREQLIRELGDRLEELDLVAQQRDMLADELEKAQG